MGVPKITRRQGNCGEFLHQHSGNDGLSIGEGLENGEPSNIDHHQWPSVERERAPESASRHQFYGPPLTTGIVPECESRWCSAHGRFCLTNDLPLGNAYS